MMRGIWLLFALLPVLPAHSEVTLDVPGGDELLEQNLVARLALASEPCDAPDWRVKRLFKRAEDDFRPALRAFGYYQAKVTKTLDSDDQCWHAKFTVEPGERVTIKRRSVTVLGEASNDKRLPSLLSTLPLAEGDSLNHGQYEEIKTRLSDFAVERGYFEFNLTRKVLRVDPAEAAAEIDIEAQSGPRYRFGELRMSELPLNEDFLRRLAKINVGAHYDARELTVLDRNLSNIGYFKRVEVLPRRDESSGRQVPVDLILEMAPRHAWRAGIGYATDLGVRVSLDYTNRYVNSKGHKFSSEIRLSQAESGLTSSYNFPGRDPSNEEFSLGVLLLHEDTDSVLSDSATLIGKQTLTSKRWTQTRFIELLYEDSVVGNDATTATLLMPGITLERIHADNPLRTNRGYRVSLGARAAHESFLSTSSMVQLRANAKGIYRFGKGGRLVSRLDVGTTMGDSIGDLPASLRFFAGGDNSVRGYAYKSLGPVDEEGEPTGARHLLTGTLEYEHPIMTDDWWLALFVDAGNAFNSNDLEFEYGTGAGLRWYSPVGRIRLDIAVPSDTEEDDWRLHFGLGADL